MAAGPLAGVPVVVVAFRGSDDPQAWLTGIRDIDRAYASFQALVAAIEAYAAQGGRVILVGHSLGGAMVQLFMYGHPHDDHFRAVTFGSPGALPKPGLFARRRDDRIVNYVISDDPFVFMGEHRAEVMAYAERHPLYGLALALGVAHASGLPLLEVVASARYASAGYVNNGARVVLPGRVRALTPATVILARPAEHDVETYVARTIAADLGAGAAFGRWTDRRRAASGVFPRSR